MPNEDKNLSLSTPMDSENSTSESQTEGSVSKTRKLGDWIDGFLEFTNELPSPRLFRLWSAITAVGGAAERRLWFESAGEINYPNLFTLLIAPPAVGKTVAIGAVERFWHFTKKLHVAPRSVTRASLVDELAESKRSIPTLNGAGLIEYSSLLVAADEFGVLVSAHDLDFLSVLNKLYDNPPIHSEKRRTLKINHQIINPQLTMLAGSQPSFLANLLPEVAWGMGFMARPIMVYSGTPIKVKLFRATLKDQALRSCLLSDMGQIADLLGMMRVETDVEIELQRWYEEGMPPIPEHSKLVHYNGRRIMHINKLMMISSLSRSNDKTISMIDLNRARDWLLEVETHMPDVFREMAGRSDGQVIHELHFFMFALWSKTGHKPIHSTAIWNFLKTQLPSERIQRVIEVAERSNVIARIAGEKDLYIPRPRNEHGIE